MTSFDNNKYKQLINNCNLAFKRVLKKELSRNRLKHIEYAIALTTAYNEYVSYSFSFFNAFSAKSQESVKGDWSSVRDKLNQSFSKILNEFDVPKEFKDHIDIKQILKDNLVV